MTTRERIDEVLTNWPELADQSVAAAADEVARVLVDKDVAAGEYEGCSSELESAYVQYEAQAREVIEQRQRVATHRRRDEIAANRGAHNRRLHEGGR